MLTLHRQAKPQGPEPGAGHPLQDVPSHPSTRPTALREMVGQADLVAQVRVTIRGARLRHVPVPHFLFDGPPGFGKTTLAQVIAAELGSGLQCTTGMMLRRPADVVGLLLRLKPGEVLFIDEVHAASKPVLEVLYSALEDNRVSLLVGSGADARAHVAHLPQWTCVAATTAPGSLPEPFRARFGFKGTMAPYEGSELAEIVIRAWRKRGVSFSPDAPLVIAQRSKGTPRIALHLAERVLDWCYCQEELGVEEGMAAEALDFFGIDEQGFDKVDHRILRALGETFAGRSVGIEALSQAVGLDRSTLEAREAPLVASGLMTRTSRGRMALPALYDLLRPPAEPEEEPYEPQVDPSQARALAEQHEAYLDGLEAGPYMLRAPRKHWDAQAHEHRYSGASDYDWFYSLAADEQERLRRNWMSEPENSFALSPDELAEKVPGGIYGWLEETRLIDALKCIAAGRTPKFSRYGGPGVLQVRDMLVA